MTFISGDFSLALYMHFFFFLLLRTSFLSKIFNNKLKNGGARAAPLENMLLPIHRPTTTKDICEKTAPRGNTTSHYGAISTITKCTAAALCLVICW